MGYSPFKYATFKFYASLIVISMDSFLPILLLKILTKRQCMSSSYLFLILPTVIAWLPSRMHNESFAFVLSLITFVLCRVLISVIKVTQVIFLKDIFPKNTHGRVLGLASCIGGLGRLVGYVVTGMSFAWSLSNRKNDSSNSFFLLEEAFTFQLLSLCALFGACTTMIFTDELEQS